MGGSSLLGGEAAHPSGSDSSTCMIPSSPWQIDKVAQGSHGREELAKQAIGSVSHRS